MTDNRVEIDSDASILAWLNSPDGPVADFLMELAERAAVIAAATVPETSPRRSKGTDARPVGYTASEIHPHLGWGSEDGPPGEIYSSVVFPADPVIYISLPAEQIFPYHPDGFPFAVESLDSLDELYF